MSMSIRGRIKSLGGLRASFYYFLGTGAAALGLYRRYKQVDWSRVERLVFVCSGNICRSPYAAEYARSLGIPIASFGVDTRGNDTANDVASKVAAARGVDLSNHRSRSKDKFA